MSVSLCTVGQHHLNTDSLEQTARQLSDIFDINIRWGRWRPEDIDFVEEGRITKHENRPYHELEDSSSEHTPVLFQLDVPWDEEEEDIVHFSYMNIYREIADITIRTDDGWPWRAERYEECFWENEPPMSEEVAGWIREFRIKCKEVFGKLGCTKIFCFADSYSVTGFLEETCLNMLWSEYEDYILSGRYLDDIEEPVEYNWKEDSMIVNVSAFLSGKDPTRCKGSADVFMDDFADIK